jgi:hypothetical protein
MGNTKWPSAKSSMIDSSPIKARKEKAQTKPATKSSTIKPSSIMPREPKAETNPPRYSQMLKIERPYLKAPELQTREMAEERLSYPLEHKGGCQLADVRSNTIFGKVCVCITGRPSPEPEGKYPLLP